MPMILGRVLALAVAALGAASVIYTASTTGLDQSSFTAGLYCGATLAALVVVGVMEFRGRRTRRQLRDQVEETEEVAGELAEERTLHEATLRRLRSVQEELPGTTVPTIHDFESTNQ